jgi:hypothetical protein
MIARLAMLNEWPAISSRFQQRFGVAEDITDASRLLKTRDCSQMQISIMMKCF